MLHALDLAPGDELLTSDEEHPGVLGPLATARDTRGVSVRVVPFDELPGEVRPETRLVVTSHVSWATGRVIDMAPLAASDALVVLDGAQGLGAVPVDVRALGCDFYAASGPEVALRPGRHGLPVREPGARAGPARALERLPRDGVPRARARARAPSRRPPADHGLPGPASRGVVPRRARRARGGGLRRRSTTRGHQGAERLADLLRDRGVEVAPRGASTLVSFEVPGPGGVHGAGGREQGIVIRSIPGGSYARASVGAWNTDEELERLAELAAAAAASRR